MKYIFFSILTALAFCQCQDAPPPPKNILSCYMRYDAAGKKAKAEAMLRDGATRKIIEIPGGIRYQSTQMATLPVRGITYSLEYDAVYTKEPSFDWKNDKGVPFQYSFEAPVVDSFFFDSQTLSLEKPAHLQWLGKALGKGETLVFIWENADEGKTVPMEVSTTLRAPLIEIPAAKLAQVGAGNWSLYLVRKKLSRAEVGDFQVECTAEYYTKPIQVNLK